MKVLNQTYVMSNGVTIPQIGFGTWQVKSGEEAYHSVLLALKNGYRHIDTAHAYQNERSVGEAVRASGIPRDEIFVTSKLPSHVKDYQGTLDHFEETMANLGLAVLDLYLIHAPWPWHEIGKDCKDGNVEAWKAMVQLYHDKRIRAIGVSNFAPADIDYIVKHTGFVPHANQIAFFIGIDQKETLDYCKTHNILVEAYSPLAIGFALKNGEIQKMADKYGVTAAQICIRYCIEKETLPLPKTTKEHRMIENASVDFTISKEDMKVLEAIKGDPRRWD
ncbi:MAG: aldo/keto reductase [Acholeplasmataceae bacterium]|nr:MAG: aldo/keto reductase [Acholeplasmataceae bacterium]